MQRHTIINVKNVSRMLMGRGESKCGISSYGIAVMLSVFLCLSLSFGETFSKRLRALHSTGFIGCRLVVATVSPDCHRKMNSN